MNPEEIKKANLMRVIYIAVCFMTLFTAYSSAQNLIGRIYSQLGYGSLGQICLFFGWGLMGGISAVAAHFNKKISTKTGLVAGASAHVSLIAAGAFTTFCQKYNYEVSEGTVYFINIFCSICMGTGAAFLWLGQATYVNKCADEKTKGIFNGLFWSVFQTAQIWSSSLASIILGSFDEFTFYSILLIFGLISLVMLSLVQPPVDNGEQEAKPVENDQETLAEALGRFRNLFGEEKCYFLFLGLIFSGIAIGCYISFLGGAVTTTLDTDNNNIINQNIGFVFLVLAFGEVAAGLSMGRLADRFDKVKLFTVTMMLNEVALLITLLACVCKSYNLALLAGLLWGYGDTAIQTMINAVIGSVFNGRVELFSAYRFFQAMGLVYSAIFSVIVPKDMPILYIILIAGSMLGFHTMYQRYTPKERSPSENYYLLAEEKKLMYELKNI